MFAVLALITFCIVLFGGAIGGLNLLALGLVFISAHLIASAWSPWWPFRDRAP